MNAIFPRAELPALTSSSSDANRTTSPSRPPLGRPDAPAERGQHQALAAGREHLARFDAAFPDGDHDLLGVDVREALFLQHCQRQSDGRAVAGGARHARSGEIGDVADPVDRPGAREDPVAQLDGGADGLGREGRRLDRGQRGGGGRRGDDDEPESMQWFQSHPRSPRDGIKGMRLDLDLEFPSHVYAHAPGRPVGRAALRVRRERQLRRRPSEPIQSQSFRGRRRVAALLPGAVRRGLSGSRPLPLRRRLPPLRPRVPPRRPPLPFRRRRCPANGRLCAARRRGSPRTCRRA